jgi:hypothetical protein
MIRTLTAIGLGMSCVLLAADEAAPKIQATKTERIDFPSGGTLKLMNSMGELTVQGWDRSDVEIATIKSPRTYYDARDGEKAARELDKVRVTAERRGEEVIISTDFPRRRGLDLRYDIKVPRNAKLVVDRHVGEVHIADVAGDIHVTGRQGAITLHLPGAGQYAIDAKSGLGSVISDFPGIVKPKRLGLGHAFIENPSAAAQKLYLRIGYGDILILQERRPPRPPPLAP